MINRYSKKIDILSYGCLLYLIARNHLLFKARDCRELLTQIMLLSGKHPLYFIENQLFMDTFDSELRFELLEIKENFFFFLSDVDISFVKKIEKSLLPYRDDSDIREIKALAHLIAECVQWEPERRPSAEEALAHTFFQL